MSLSRQIHWVSLAVFITAGWLYSPARAQDTSTQPTESKNPPTDASGAKAVPAPAPLAAGQQALQAIVKSVSGIAHHRRISDPNSKWQPVQAGDKLDEYTIIRTGLGSKVVLQFADRGETTVKAASKVGIAEFRKVGNHVTTRMGIKYGSMRSQVDSSRGTNDYRIKTPVATLSVRGTSGHLGFAGDRGLGLNGTTGTFNVAQNGGGNTNVRGRESTNGSLAQNRDIINHRMDTRMGDASGGLTQTEVNNMINNGGGRGVIGFAGSNRGAGGAPGLNTGGMTPPPLVTTWTILSGQWTEAAAGYGTWSGMGLWQRGVVGGKWVVPAGSGTFNQSTLSTGDNWSGSITGNGLYGVGVNTPNTPFHAVMTGSGTATETGTSPTSHGTINSGSGVVTVGTLGDK